jgi:hypothetical protein
MISAEADGSGNWSNSLRVHENTLAALEKRKHLPTKGCLMP